MKTALLIGLVLLVNSAVAQTTEQVNRIVNAIYYVEGGPKAKVPYGILSVRVKNKEDARKICFNTVKNNIARWQKQTQEKDFLVFLANRYCPPSVDPKGNANWKKNIKAILQKNS
jgi:hypothetical protein